MDRVVKPITVTLDEDRLAWLDAEAEKRKLNRSEYLRRLIDEKRELQGNMPS